jgi:secreted Zn-dependent insulinase-like peptidase
LFCTLCGDALTKTCYLASVCELGSSIRPTDTGFSTRVHGFNHNLLTLAKEVLRVVMSFRGRDGECDLPSTKK